MRGVPGTTSAFAERAVGGNYLDITIDRREAARFGLQMGDIQKVIQTALGGMSITTTVEGLERYTVNLRYSRELRDNIESIRHVLVPSAMDGRFPLAKWPITPTKGPMVVRSENTRPNAWVFVDIRGIDIGTYIKNAQKAVARDVKLPTGYTSRLERRVRIYGAHAEKNDGGHSADLLSLFFS